MALNAKKLNQAPFFPYLENLIRDEFKPFLDTIWLNMVEVIPDEGKWILHLFSSSSTDEDVFKEISQSLEIYLNKEIIVEWMIEENKPLSLEDLYQEQWELILDDLLQLMPSLKGWLSSSTKVEVEENKLIFYVPNLMVMDFLKAKEKVITRYFLNKYQLDIGLCCYVEDDCEEKDFCFNPEEEEHKYASEILAINSQGIETGQKDERTAQKAVILGKDFKGKPLAISEIKDEEKVVNVEGCICEVETRLLKSGRQLLTFGITDKSNSICCKLFVNEGQELPAVKQDDWCKIRGSVQFDRYTTELTLMPKDIVKIAPILRMDQAEKKRVELHLHTKSSEMDGVSSVQTLIERAAFWGHEAVAVTDHGVVQAFPDAADASQKYGIKVILGMEGYLVDDTDSAKNWKNQKYNHIIILAKDKAGLKNLYQIVTKSHLDYFYRRPRVPKSLLNKHREGLLLGSACEAGELIRSIIAQKDWEDLKKIASFYDYLEIQPAANNLFLVKNGEVSNLEQLKQINHKVVELGKELDIPVAATCDVHFLDKEDEVFRRILMAGKGYQDADDQAPLFFRTTEEMLEEFSYLGEDKAYEVVVANPQIIADQIEKLKPFPDEFFEPKIEGAEEKIKSMTWNKAYELYGTPLPEVVEKVINKELASIIGNGFSVLYLISHLLVKKSNDDGYLVGSRGSVGSSLVATFTGITEVNPLPPHYRCPNKDCKYSEFILDGSIGSGVDLPDKTCPQCQELLLKDGHDIPFETFLGFKGDKVPDIDLNFSGEYQPRAHKYTEEIFGKENVFRAGTISTVAEKTAFGFVKNYLDERSLKYNQTEINRLVRGCAGVKRTTGQHPGGLMVVPKECDVFDFTPLQRPANDSGSETITTHFDYHSISGRLVKLDILGHDDPTSIKMLEDLTGVNAKNIPLDDVKTLSLFSGTEALGVSAEELGVKTGTLGIPEFGTKFVRQMLEDTKPKTFSHLVRISGLSHGTNVWLGNAQDLVLEGTADISQIIACRDDIMIYLIQKGLNSSQAFKIMEAVRKGKGLKPEDIEEMQANNVPQWYIESCQKISYMFPKAHAVAYVMMAFRIAWFKVYYPEAFYTTFFTVRADEFDADLICQGLEKCRETIKTINNKGNDATQKEKNLLTILELAVEMYCRSIKLRKVNLWESDAVRFLLTPQGILPPFSSLQGLGVSAAKSLAQIRDHGSISSIEELQAQARLSKTVIEVLSQHGCLEKLPKKNQLSLF